jgi:hypothetical protein
VTAFFIPGSEDHLVAERAYAGMRATLERELGSRPTQRRIATLWTRRGSTDCITEVGAPDPLRGGTVLAIFDMGQRKPFVICWQPTGDRSGAVREILGPNAYSVVEFDS